MVVSIGLPLFPHLLPVHPPTLQYEYLAVKFFLPFRPCGCNEFASQLAAVSELYAQSSGSTSLPTSCLKANKLPLPLQHSLHMATSTLPHRPPVLTPPAGQIHQPTIFVLPHNLESIPGSSAKPPPVLTTTDAPLNSYPYGRNAPSRSSKMPSGAHLYSATCLFSSPPQTTARLLPLIVATTVRT